MRRLALLSTENKEDIKKKLELLQKAYDLGDNLAAYALGKTYERDIKEEGHIEEAIHWYKIGAEKHDCFESQLKLGDLALQGELLQHNINQAVIWYKKAIETYNKSHQHSYLGIAYERLLDRKSVV